MKLLTWKNKVLPEMEDQYATDCSAVIEARTSIEEEKGLRFIKLKRYEENLPKRG